MLECITPQHLVHAPAGDYFWVWDNFTAVLWRLLENSRMQYILQLGKDGVFQRGKHAPAYTGRKYALRWRGVSFWIVNPERAAAIDMACVHDLAPKQVAKIAGCEEVAQRAGFDLSPEFAIIKIQRVAVR